MGSGSTNRAYAEAVEALAARGRFGIHLGLGRTRALLRALGHPERAIRGALVGGTNGKGSVLALAGSVLRHGGFRVGETPKPHLVSYRERLQIAGRPIDRDTFIRLVDEILVLAERVERKAGPPTEFELLTAMVFRWFADEAIDLALVEVGLGGRLDATHAWDGGVAVITNVALDHMDRLGSTIPEIAREKAAIINRGDLAVTGAEGGGLAVIRRRAKRVGAPLRIVEPAGLISWDRDGIDVDLPRLGRTRVGLRGRHQAQNVAVADALLDALAEAGIARVTDADRRTGYATAVWPGRLELLDVPRPEGGQDVGGRRGRVPRSGTDDEVEVLLDGAHNPAGAAALAVALDDLRPHLRPGVVTLVQASMADKDVEGVIRALAASEALRGARIIATSLDVARALGADDLAARWRAMVRGSNPTIEADPDRALDRALSDASGPVVVAGSLYLVGRVRGRLVDDPLLGDLDPAGGPTSAWRASTGSRRQ
jgi:dihydrofolate synthase / folylpolyglutamate synthase